MVLLDAAILMNPNVWVASGHVGGFSDPLIDDKKTKERFRADKLLEEIIEEIKNEFSKVPESILTPRIHKLLDRYIELNNQQSKITKESSSFVLEATGNKNNWNGIQIVRKE